MRAKLARLFEIRNIKLPIFWAALSSARFRSAAE
jgi:hypothetical protein